MKLFPRKRKKSPVSLFHRGGDRGRDARFYGFMILRYKREYQNRLLQREHFREFHTTAK